MLLSYHELVRLAAHGAITGLKSKDQINGSSIDVQLGDTILYEKPGEHVVTLRNRDPLNMLEFKFNAGNMGKVFALQPGEFILAHTVEKFNMPSDLSATFHLKSTSARTGLGHLLAVHIDPGFTDSVLTLEIHNVTRYHTVMLQHEDLIGQILFWRHPHVPELVSYKQRGHYNHDHSVSGVKK